MSRRSAQTTALPSFSSLRDELLSPVSLSPVGCKSLPRDTAILSLFCVGLVALSVLMTVVDHVATMDPRREHIIASLLFVGALGLVPFSVGQLRAKPDKWAGFADALWNHLPRSPVDVKGRDPC